MSAVDLESGRCYEVLDPSWLSLSPGYSILTVSLESPKTKEIFTVLCLRAGTLAYWNTSPLILGEYEKTNDDGFRQNAQ